VLIAQLSDVHVGGSRYREELLRTVVSVGLVVEVFRVGVEDAFQFVQVFDRLGDVLFSEFLDESF
jgi:hypothetical protein